MIDKNDPGKANRTFETRLQFINSIFSEPHSKQEILASCIQLKLKMTYEQYLENLRKSLNYLKYRNTDKVLTKISKE